MAARVRWSAFSMVVLGWVPVSVGCTVNEVGSGEGDGSSEGSSGMVDGTSSAMSTTGSGATGQSSLDETAGWTDDGPREDLGLDLPPLGPVDCRDEPPPGAQVAPPLPTYEGVCPELMPGLNAIDSSGNLREFLLIVPEDLDPTERLPVIFLWHWLGGDAQGFLEQGDVQNAVDQFRFAAVIPESDSSLLFRWPFTILDPESRVEEEYRFFDDMLACVGEQLNVEPNCVSSAGVSAGALWTSQLASGRGEHLSSFMSLSGGTGGAVVRPWGGTSHAMPAMVLWGGDMDFCIAIDFSNTSQIMEQDLSDEGHFILECIHNCSHSAPPFEVAEGETAFAPLWSFVFSHPYWLAPGDSPYLSTGVPPEMPEWCGIGMGSATERVGECGPDQC